MQKFIQGSNAYLQNTPYAILVFAIYQQIAAYYSRLGEPLLGMYEFRETQTALSAYWMSVGGPKLIYETPVLGLRTLFHLNFRFSNGL